MPNVVGTVIKDLVILALVLAFWIGMDTAIEDVITLAPDDPNTTLDEATIQQELRLIFQWAIYVFVFVIILHAMVAVLRRTSDRAERIEGGAIE